MGMDINCYLEEFNIEKNEWYVPTEYVHNNRINKFWNDRSYYTFAWLGCNFRARFIIPINECRGIPNDISKELKNHHWFTDSDAFGYSYLYFNELLDYFKIPVFIKAHFDQEYLNYIKRENKNIWDDHNWIKKANGVIETNFTLPIEEIVNNDFICKVTEISKNKNPKNLRIVFCFDS